LRKGINFIEQASIGPWCVDFYLPDSNACVEADGEYWHGTFQSAKIKDRRKDLWLQSRGYEIYHFDGWDIKQDADFCVSRMMKSLEAKAMRKRAAMEDDPIEETESLGEIATHDVQTNKSEHIIDEYEQWLGNT
jgi:very-short-patch-repair endonuclease